MKETQQYWNKAIIPLFLLLILTIQVNAESTTTTIDDFDNGVSTNWTVYDGETFSTSTPGFNGTGSYGHYHSPLFPTGVTIINTVNSSRRNVEFFWKPNSSSGSSIAAFLTSTPFANYTGAWITTDPASGKVQIINNALATVDLYTTTWTQNQPTRIGIEGVNAPNGTIIGFNYYVNGTLTLSNISIRGHRVLPNIGQFGLYVGNNGHIAIDTIIQRENLSAINNIIVNIFDEKNLSMITNVNFTIKRIQIPTILFNFTTTGTKTILANSLGLWQVDVLASNYQKRTSYVNLTVYNDATINQYMAVDNLNVTIIALQSPNGIPILNATLYQYSPLNNSNVLIDMKTSDVLGSFSVTGNHNQPYTFTITAPGYNPYTFSLQDLADSTYTVHLTLATGANNNADWFNMLYEISPALYYNSIQNNLSFSITDNDHNLTSYGINATYPGGTTTTVGSNPSGSTLWANFTTTGLSNHDNLNLTYWYYKNGINHTFYKTYYLINSTYPTGSLLDVNTYDFGLGTLERVIIMIVFSLLIAWAGTRIAGETGGLVLGLLSIGAFSYILHVSRYLIIPGILLGIFLISKRSS